MQRHRYRLIWEDTLDLLVLAVDTALNEKPVYEPCGGPFQSESGKWYQAIFWKESE